VTTSRRSFLLLLPATIVLAACGPTAAAPALAPVVSAVPFADGERLVYTIRDDSGANTARGTLSVHRDGEALRLEQRYEEASPPPGAQPNVDETKVAVGADDLQPQSMARTVTGRDLWKAYAANYAADGKSVVISEGDAKPRTIPLPTVVYDNESSLWLWRTLPLADGYRVRYVSLDAIGKTRQTVDLTVTGKQTVEVPAGKFEAWRLQIRNGRATRIAWVNVDATHEIVQWDNGSQVFRLESR
jgi:hypothetical protein